MINEIATWNYVRGNRNFTKKLETDMLFEEWQEFVDAETDIDMADALADLIFVAVGGLYKLSGDAYRAECIMAEVIKANFKKGATKNEYGKVVKPADFVGPETEIEKILEPNWDSYINKNGHIYE